MIQLNNIKKQIQNDKSESDESESDESESDESESDERELVVNVSDECWLYITYCTVDYIKYLDNGIFISQTVKSTNSADEDYEDSDIAQINF